MALNTIWVHAEVGGDKPSSITLELISKARTLADKVEAFYAGDNAEAVATELGTYGVSKVYTVATEGLQGIPLASAMAAQIESGNTPDLIMFGSTYDGRDVLARLSVALDRPVLTNNTGLEVEGDEVRVTTSIFGGTTNVTTAFRCEAPHLASFRPKSFVAEPGGEATPEVVAAEATEQGKVTVHERHVEEHTGPILDEASLVVAGGRGLGTPRSTTSSRAWPSCSRALPAPAGPSSTPVGCPTATRSDRPARWSSPTSTSRSASPVPPSTWSA